MTDRHWRRLIIRTRNQSELRSKIIFRRMVKRHRLAGKRPLMTTRTFKRFYAPIAKARKIETLCESRMIRNRV